MVFKKKQMVAGAMVLVVCLAVYLNWQFNRPDDTDLVDDSLSTGEDVPYDADKVLGQARLVSSGISTGSESAEDYFVEAKLVRQTTRDESIELLESVTNNINNPEDVRRQAAIDIGSIAKAIEKEGKIENLLAAKGFENSLAVISDSSITVIVQSDGLEKNQLAQISEIVRDETGLGGAAVKIVPING